MTQFPPTSDFPPAAPPGGHHAAQQPPYSGAAIAGFVLSLLGCAGVTAVLGFILGIVGILSTRGGRRRGMGLAVAAIPISLVTGGLSMALLFSMLTVGRGTAVLVQLPIFLSGDPASLPDSAKAIRELGTDSFQTAVSEEDLTKWLAHVAEQHGGLTDATDPDVKAPVQTGTAFAFEFDGTFENGPASIVVRFALDGWIMKLDDIEIDGVSPASMKE